MDTNLKLNDGYTIPMLAYGTGTAHIRSKMARGTHGQDIIDRDCVEQIKLAIRAGYRHLDNAEMYGTEREAGVAIVECLEDGTIASREELFITSKTEKGALQAAKSLDQSLARLGPAIEYVDLYLIHSPYFASSDEELQAAWAAMEEVKSSGKAHSIGVSNYEESHLKATLATAKIPPAINQIEFHPYMTRRNGSDLLAQLRADGVAVSAYGLLSPMTRNIAGPLDEVLVRIATTHRVSPGMICLRWAIEQGVVVITTSQKEDRMKEYLRLFDFTLSSDECNQITDAGLACVAGKEDLKPRIIHYYESQTAKQ